ncbi:MAG: ABC transporter permease, partial [Armatimonadota bacterium]
MVSEAIANLLRYAAPVAIAATGETIGQRAGVLNIGLEGTMLSASYVGLLTDQATGNPWAALWAGVLTGIVVGLLQAWFTLGMAADSVVVGTAVNLLALGVTSTAYRFRFGNSGQLLRVPTLPQAGGWDGVMVLSLALAVAGTLLLFRTKWGLLARASGEYPPAVVASG